MDVEEAFDTAEALNVLAHDYGLYAVKSELDRIGFRAGSSRDTFEGIDDTGRDIYRAHSIRAELADPYTVPDWAERLLRAIETAEGE